MGLQPVVSWAFSPDSDVAGYRIYYRTGAQAYDVTRMIDIPVPCRNWYRLTSQVVPWVTNFVRMTAYDTSNNESAQSNESSLLVQGGLLLK